jgi:thioredoxin-related protein
MKLSVILWVFVLLLCLSVGLPSGVAVSQEIQWHSFNAGMARGKFEKKKVFVHFYADWCAGEIQTASMFRVKGLPDNWFIGKEGEIIGHRPGYIPPDQLKNILTLIQNQETDNQ